MFETDLFGDEARGRGFEKGDSWLPFFKESCRLYDIDIFYKFFYRYNFLRFFLLFSITIMYIDFYFHIPKPTIFRSISIHAKIKFRTIK